MTNPELGSTRPALVGIACAFGAVGLGLAYLNAAGAPIYMLAINAGALILGLATVLVWARLPAAPPHVGGIAKLLMSFALLATAVSGLSADGISRWAMIGSLAVQPSLILLPIIILMFVRDRGLVATASVLVAALAIAMQPDRAMAGVMMCSLAVLAIIRLDRSVLIALVASISAFVVTMILPDRSPAVPYVDQILYKAFDVHFLAGMAVAAGAALLLVPALHGIRFGSEDRTLSLVFGAVWLTVIVAAALGNYPTPLVGFGGSAILGYLLSLGVLLRSTNAQIATPPSADARAAFHAEDIRSRLAPHQLA